MEYTEVSDCRMEQGSLRCDVNVSIRKKGDEKLGTKVEIKNLNSFKEIQKALEWEQLRQQKLLRTSLPEQIIPETRRWDDIRGITVPMRAKDGARLGCIAPEPDLPLLDLNDSSMLHFLEESLPELGAQKRNRFVSRYGLSRYEADILTKSKQLADYYEDVVNNGAHPKEAANWILVELLRLWRMSEHREIPVAGQSLAELIMLVDEGEISRNAGKTVLSEMYETGKDPRDIINQKGLAQINSENEIKKIVEAVLDQNKNAAADYKKGSTKAAGYLMGQIMKAGEGRVNPNIAREILEDRLNKL
jgi:aspartyl-tRNA(Asn)/glutamyl-tRNA(Gln) amidotransferase subunit B